METQRELLDAQLLQLKEAREPWLIDWKDLAENFLSWRSKALFTAGQRTGKRNKKLMDTAPVLALRTLASGMMAGYTSPARPWHRMATPDPEMMEYAPVRSWLYVLETRMRDVFSRSNLYNVLPTRYKELGAFGTGPMIVLEDERDVIRCVPFTAGSYLIATGADSKVDTLFREFRMTVRQMVQMFGVDALGANAKSLWNSAGQKEKLMDVVHAVRPRQERDPSMADARNMAWSSCYYEPVEKNKYLRESGFEGNPILSPRWDVTEEDAYGIPPTFDALANSKALQIQQKRKAQAIDKHVDPPMWADASLKNQRASLLPGDITYSAATATGGNPGFQPVYKIKPEIGPLLEDIQDIRQWVSKAMYEDLFLMLAMSDRKQITAREIEERHEEKLLMLGPVLERLNDELLGPLIDRTFDIMVKRSIPYWEGRLDGEPLLPPPPPELEDVKLKVEYISILAQAQRAVATVGMERYVSFAVAMAPVHPEVMDKVDVDQTMDEYANALGVPPMIVRSDDEVEELRAQRQQAQQMQQMAAMAQPVKDAAQAAKLASETQVGDTTMLNQMTGNT